MGFLAEARAPAVLELWHGVAMSQRLARASRVSALLLTLPLLACTESGTPGPETTKAKPLPTVEQDDPEDAEQTPEADAERRFPKDAVLELARHGILGAPLPKELGGQGWDALQLVQMYEELGRVDQSIRGFLSVHVGLVSQCLAKFGTDAQRERWLPGLADGSTFGAYALTETGAGSDAAALTTQAHPDGDGWRISGETSEP